MSKKHTQKSIFAQNLSSSAVCFMTKRFTSLKNRKLSGNQSPRRIRQRLCCLILTSSCLYFPALLCFQAIFQSERSTHQLCIACCSSKQAKRKVTSFNNTELSQKIRKMRAPNLLLYSNAQAYVIHASKTKKD